MSQDDVEHVQPQTPQVQQPPDDVTPPSSNGTGPRPSIPQPQVDTPPTQPIVSPVVDTSPTAIEEYLAGTHDTLRNLQFNLAAVTVMLAVTLMMLWYTNKNILTYRVELLAEAAE